MEKKIPPSKEEDKQFNRIVMILILGTFMLSILFGIVFPAVYEEALMIMLSSILIMQFLIFAWVFRLRYHFLGPLGKYEEFSEDSDPLKKVED